MPENNYSSDSIANRAKKKQISSGGFNSAQKPTREKSNTSGVQKQVPTESTKMRMEKGAKHNDGSYTNMSVTPPYDIADM
jgi:hypothetical protein